MRRLLAFTAAPTPAAMSLPTPDATVQALPLPAGLALSLEAEVIAECLYEANALQLGDAAAPVPYDQLPAMVRAAYRDAAIIAIQRIAPHVHAQAVQTAEAVLPGFGAALAVYQSALLYGPARAR